MRSLTAACAAVACLVLAAGCAGKDDAPTTAPPGESPSSTSTSGATDTPSATTSTTSATDAPPTETPLVDRLLPTRLVPGLNAQWTWQDGETGPAGTAQFGVCAKADLASIGAVTAFERTYFPPDDSDDSAAEQVAEFPDATTAARAWSVLQSWYAHCKQKAGNHPGLVVSKLVDLPNAAARWYLLSWTPAGEETGRFEAFGMALSGTRMAVVRMDNSGADHNYPHEPIAQMLAAAASALD
ncbi:MAG TPA: hypothetical protein VFE07_15335 [Marmoricola sp.]|nr:hypothetical protein [Marmoricola sp.]